MNILLLFKWNQHPVFSTKGQCKIADLKISEVLPSVESNLTVENDFVVLVTRMVVKFLPAFTLFRDVVIHHNPHQYSNKMARKSDVVRIICKIGQRVFFRTLQFYFPNLIHHLVQFINLTLPNENGKNTFNTISMEKWCNPWLKQLKNNWYGR